MTKIEELADQLFKKQERLRMLGMMNTPVDYEQRKKSFIALKVAEYELQQAELAMKSLPSLMAPY
jgi:hypothetical protein